MKVIDTLKGEKHLVDILPVDMVDFKILTKDMFNIVVKHSKVTN